MKLNNIETSIKSKAKCSAKVYLLRQQFTDEILAKKLGITRATLYTRLRNDNWKKSEAFLISQIEL